MPSLRSRTVLAAIWALVVLSLAWSARAAERPRLTIYTASQKEQVAATEAAVARLVPEADIAWVRASTGIITNRVLEEGRFPKADMIFGLSASSMLVLKQAALLEAYRPEGVDQIRSSFLDPGAPYSFTGMDVYFPVICMNVEQAKRDRVASPMLWRDLADASLKGRIVMAHPGSSGTGYGLVAGWLQSMGEAAGWAFMDALHENVDVYLHTGSAPCLDVAHGKHLLGLGLDMRAAVEKARGAPIETIIPLDRVGWDLETFGIIRGTPHLTLAKRIADWAVTREANEIYAQSYSIVAHPGARIPAAIALSHAEARMAKVSLAWMAENRERVIAEWVRRYDAKAAPR
ncbi:extracellular solute-binding protein [Methylobacterium durans]|uniref:extracellular solute-binding protein n=1 Tax=Methylobacterium durans TaxID=2202825 RepID=UPI001F40DBD5|nr:extracellular solute-binding protein [Methylobacterium durans]